MNEQQRNKMLGVLAENLGLFKDLPTIDGQFIIQNPKEAISLIKRAVKDRHKTVGIVSETEYLKLIPGAEALVIDQCDGARVIADASDVFTGYIDSDFRGYKADEIGVATPDTPVNVFELTKNGVFSNIFGSFSIDNDKLCLTQDQIIGFVKKHRNWLREDGYATFFMFKSHNNFFVADVDFNSDGQLSVRVYRLENDFVWDAGLRYRFVVPQLVA